MIYTCRYIKLTRGLVFSSTCTLLKLIKGEHLDDDKQLKTWLIVQVPESIPSRITYGLDPYIDGVYRLFVRDE